VTIQLHRLSLRGTAGQELESSLSIGTLPVPIARVSGPDDALRRASKGLPQGAAHAEALAVRARREGFELRWGEPDWAANLSSLLDFCCERGRSSVDLVRADPSLTPEMEIGTWFDAGYRRRLARRAALQAPASVREALVPASGLAFWSGVRTAASKEEWTYLTRSSYVALLYHRVAGENKPGQEKLDVSPRRFAAHLRLLRRLGFRPLSADEVVSFHLGTLRTLLRRRFALTIDDGTADCAEPLAAARWATPQLFVSTAEVGGLAHWLASEQLLSWTDLGSLVEAGVEVGSHARHHLELSQLSPVEIEDELRGSMADLRRQLTRSIPVVAYPHGRNNELVRGVARDAGFEVGYATRKGRNGVATNRYALRRVSVYGYDGALALLWKASTGEAIPRIWELWRARRTQLRRRFHRTRPAVASSE